MLESVMRECIDRFLTKNFSSHTLMERLKNLIDLSELISTTQMNVILQLTDLNPNARLDLDFMFE